MLTIETYKGSAEELAQFVKEAWTHSYAGRMTFPNWTAEFFEWQFRLDSDTSRQNLVAAYDDLKLVGVLLGTDYPFRSPAGLHIGSNWSWLSIHPDYRGRGIAKLLDQERVIRQAAVNSRLIVSYRYFGSQYSQSEQPRNGTRDPKFNRRISFWFRVLDPRRFANWHWSRIEGFFAKLASPLARIPESAKADSSIRPFALTDLDACLSLVSEANSTSILAIAWDHDSLGHQLCGSEICQTLVIEERGQVTGFVNFFVLPFRARTIEKVAIFDLIVFGKTSSRGCVRLMNAALRRMHLFGAVLALKVKCGDTSYLPMLKTHFLPQFPDSYLVLQSVGDQIDIPASSRVHLLWR